MFEGYITQAFLIVALCSGLPILAGSAAGLFAAIIQTATQVQEQSISFVVKFMAVALVLGLGGRWFSAELTGFFQEVLGSLAALGRMR